MLVLVKFKVQGNMRFLSHAETLKVFQRACARAGIQIKHTQGFNPHPKLSLPLPRPVGVESDDELLCLHLSRSPNEPRGADYEARIMAGLSEQLPNSLSIVDCQLSIVNGKSPIPKPCSATYIFAMRRNYLNARLKATVRRLLASESLNIRRRREKGKSTFKNVDVRPFLKSIELDNNSIIVQCAVSPIGSIRVDEILELLELDVDKLAAPIRRTNVQWQQM